jgi:hypothetical protein
MNRNPFILGVQGTPISLAPLCWRYGSLVLISHLSAAVNFAGRRQDTHRERHRP